MRSFLSILAVFPLLTFSQIGGQQGFQSLTITTNPRAAALAGSTVSLADGDISQFFENPATLDSVRAGALFFHVNPYYVDAAFFSMATTFDVKEVKGLTFGVHYLDFGDFQMTDATGTEIGSFRAADYVLTLGKSTQLGPFSLGANIKFINSSIDIYNASAIAADLGGLFRISKSWSVGMVFENMGVVLSQNQFTKPSVPFDVKIGTTFKPEYMPLRFTITSSNLVNENLSLTENASGRSNSEVDRILRRLNFGAELLFSENFQILLGYNHKRKQELRLDTTGGGAGFSYGLMVKIRRYELRFSRATFHAAGGSSFISLQTNLKDFKKIL